MKDEIQGGKPKSPRRAWMDVTVKCEFESQLCHLWPHENRHVAAFV